MTAKPLAQRQANLPYGKHLIEEDDLTAVNRVLRSDRLTTGPTVLEFERALSLKVEARATVCSSGTAALHLAALMLDLKPGDSVVVPTITFLATANAVRYTGADVIFADVDPDTGLLTPDSLETALRGKRARAVIPVHLAGQCANMDKIGGIAREYGLHVVEDACHALGGTCGGSPVGACAQSDMNVTVFSFHPVKTIAMGEGGAITTRNPIWAQRLKELRNHGMIRHSPHSYEMLELGFNYRASDIHCALGLSQLAKLDRFVAERRKIMGWYAEALAPLAPLVKPLSQVPWCNPAWHLNVVLIDFLAAGVSRSAVIRTLAEKGIGSQIHYFPVHRQPYYRRLYGDQHLPGAESYHERALSLPLYVGLTQDDVTRVVDELTRALTT